MFDWMVLEHKYETSTLKFNDSLPLSYYRFLLFCWRL